jgi:hypothetical protein
MAKRTGFPLFVRTDGFILPQSAKAIRPQEMCSHVPSGRSHGAYHFVIFIP